MNEAKEFFHYPTLSHLHKCKEKQGFGTGRAVICSEAAFLHTTGQNTPHISVVHALPHRSGPVSAKGNCPSA